MSWRAFRNASGQQWQMNFAGMRLLAHAYCRNKLLRKNYKKVTTNEPIGPFSLSITNIDVDWDAVKTKLPSEIWQFECGDRRLWASALSQNTVDYLADVRRQTAAWNNEMLQLLKKTTSDNYASWSALDSSLARAVWFAKLVRDSCFTFIVVAGGALSGGTALAAIGAGSVLKGAADAQDNYKGSLTDKKMLESATITTATSFVSAYLPLKVDAAKGAVAMVAPRLSGPATTLAAKGILAIGSSFTDAGGDAAKAVVQGESVPAALRNGATRFGTSLATNALGLGLDAKFSTENLPLTAKVTMPTLTNLGSKSASGVTADKAVETLGRPEEAPMRNMPPPQANAPFCISNSMVTSDRDYILNNVLRPAA